MTTEAQATQASAAANPAAAAAQPAQAAATVATAIGNPAAAVAPVASTPAAAAPAAANPAADPAKAEQGTFGESVTYQPTGDSNLDLALGFAGKHGLSPEHPVMVEASKGNFGPIKALFAEKGVQGWEAYVALAEKGFHDFTRAEAEKTLAIQKIVVAAAGSEDEWNNVLSWASANADPDEKEHVNAALAQGGVVAEAMAAYLVNLYRGAPGVSYAPQERAVTPNAARGAAASSNAPLSPREYTKAVQELRRTLGVGFESSREYQILNQRRMAYRG